VISAADAFSRATERATSARSQPMAASQRVTADPMPREAPVTSMTGRSVIRVFIHFGAGKIWILTRKVW
jgi:hypothetical protein